MNNLLYQQIKECNYKRVTELIAEDFKLEQYIEDSKMLEYCLSN